MDKLLTVREFADRINSHPHTVRKMIKNNMIQAIKIGLGKCSAYRIPETEISRMFVVKLEKVIENMAKK